MELNFSVFQEPRGVMRILHFVFSICAFATITGFSGFIKFECNPEPHTVVDFGYPFDLDIKVNKTGCFITYSFASDAKFFVATGVLAMLYALAIIVIYAKFDDMYKSNNKLPLYDFVATVIFGVLWLSSSAAWANGLTGLKSATTPTDCNETCSVTTSSFSTLNTSVIFGFLNFFLWAADLWFVYKETAWFQGAPQQGTDGV